MWRDTAAMPEYGRLEGDVRTDVLVIGGGMAGILCAHFLRQAGVDCVLAEADRLCAGTTGNTTAKITSQHGLVYDGLLRRFGAEKAGMYLHANEAALARYRGMCREIDCGFEEKDAFVYSLDDRGKLEKELAESINGYISRKVIKGKERFYLQWTENGKLKSRYIKAGELEQTRALVERRKSLQAELKKLKATPDGVKSYNLKRKAVRNMQNITGTLMSEDRVIATVKNGVITDADERLLPLYLKRTGNIEGWLASRAIDSHRTNSRLLKRALRLRTTDDIATALAVNAATVTDRYWFKPEGSTAVYEDIRFKENYFAELALRGAPDSFSRKPSRTPELTNTGSFEKCWKLIDGEWWMYKSGNKEEYFSELFICKLCKKLGLPTAHYELDGRYIRSKDFTNGAAVNSEPIRALVDDDEDYENCFHVLYGISPEIAKQYLLLLWTDSVCYNMDRHTENFGLLRDVKTGKILSLAPNYDNNIALIAKGYPSDVRRTHDGLIGFLKAFLQDCEEARELYREMRMPEITEDIIDECLDEIPIEVDREYIRTFILCGQDRVRDIIEMDGELSEDEEPDMGLTL